MEDKELNPAALGVETGAPAAILGAGRNRGVGFSEKGVHFHPTTPLRLYDPRNTPGNYQNYFHQVNG